MADDLVVDYVLTEDDYASFAAFTAGRSRLSRKRRMVIEGTTALLLALFMATDKSWRQGFVPFVINEFPLLCLVVIWALTIVFRSQIDRWWARRRFRDGSFVNCTKPARIAVSEKRDSTQRRDGRIRIAVVGNYRCRGHFCGSLSLLFVLGRRHCSQKRVRQRGRFPQLREKGDGVAQCGSGASDRSGVHHRGLMMARRDRRRPPLLRGAARARRAV